MSLFVIRSQDRTIGSISDFTINLKNPIEGGDSDELCVIDVCIPNLVYNITVANNTVVFDDGAVRTATIPVGYYTNASLSSAIGTQMTSASGIATYTAAIDSTTLLMTITGILAYTINHTSTTLSAVIGFPTTGTSVSALTQTSTQATVLDSAYFIISLDVDASQIVGTNNATGTIKCPNLASSGGVNYITTDLLSGQKLHVGQKRITSLSVRLLDDKGILVSLKADWSFTLKPHKCGCKK